MNEDYEIEDLEEEQEEEQIVLNGKPDRLFEWKEECRRATV